MRFIPFYACIPRYTYTLLHLTLEPGARLPFRSSNLAHFFAMLPLIPSFSCICSRTATHTLIIKESLIHLVALDTAIALTPHE